MRTRRRWTSLEISEGSRTSRPGFTFVELLVAVVLIEVGLLALVAAGAVSARLAALTRARITAISLATNRLQLLGAGPCVSVGGTAGQPPRFVERWSVELRQHGIRDLRDSVTVFAAGATRTVVLRTRLPC